MNDPQNTVTRETAGSSARLDDPLRRAFGFADDESWLSRLREGLRDASPGEFGPFELIAEAGRGGQGRVYRARQKSTGREVAVKRLLAGALASADSRARFEREIEAAAALDHPGIVTIYGAEVVDGQPLLAMQWIDGVPFDSWARAADGSRRDRREVLEAFALICDAIHHAHQRGVIHRDLKPSNILVDAHGVPHVLDFGVAKLEREGQVTLTGSEDFLGTPSYAAPEQLGVVAGGIDVRTDVYALGVLLYQSLTGRRPYEGASTLPQQIEALGRGDPRAPSAVERGLPRDLDAIVLTAIAREPVRRYGSVEALGADVRRFLNGEVVLAHPPSVAYRARKFLARHGLASSLAGLALAAVLSLGVVSTVTAAREHGLRIEAAEARAAAEHEARVQRETADALLQVVQRVADHVANRRSIETGTLVPWMIEPLEQGGLNLRPDALAQMHWNVAELQMTSKQRDKAIYHADRALDLLRGLDADPHGLIFTILMRRAAFQLRGGLYVDAERSAQEALELAREVDGPDSINAAFAMSKMAAAQRQQERFEEAVETYRAAIAILEELQTDIGQLSEVRSALGILHQDQGRYSLALEHFERSLLDVSRAGLRSSKYGAWQLKHVAYLLFRFGRFEEAEAHLAEIAAWRIRVYGLKYARTSQDLHLYAWVLHALGRYEETIQRLEQALVYVENESRDAMGAARMRFQMALAMFAMGRDDEARRQLLRAISKGKVTIPGDAEWDARVAEVEAAVRSHELRYDEHLGAVLGDNAWLARDRAQNGIVTEEPVPDDTPDAVPDDEPGDPPSP